MSKLNPQKATAYVGPGVLRKGGKITPVPNGPLIKKKGPYAGSTLKTGGMIKKAQNGTSQYSDPKPLFDKIKKTKDSINNATIKLKEDKFKSKMNYLKSKLKKAQTGDTIFTKKDRVDNVRTNKYVVRLPDGSIEMGKETKTKTPDGKTTTSKKSTKSAILGQKYTNEEIRKSMDSKKNGGMIKRADGSYSKRGLWDNIRANKGSGKKPTKQMLVQEKKIKAKTKK
jgi:hypothetical protein